MTEGQREAAGSSPQKTNLMGLRVKRKPGISGGNWKFQLEFPGGNSGWNLEILVEIGNSGWNFQGERQEASKRQVHPGGLDGQPIPEGHVL